MRTPSIAGTWYPDTPAKLGPLLAGWSRGEPLPGVPSVIIVPHAGYAFSGAVAASVYSRLPKDRYEEVILLAPSHCAAMPRRVSPQPAEEVTTPFGVVCFEQSLHDRLAALPGASFIAAAHEREHSIDIQLPMIRYFLPECRLGGLLVGQWDCASPRDEAALRAFARAFRQLLTPHTLVVISTDFTHYGASFSYVPFTDDIGGNLLRLDTAVFHAAATNSNRTFAECMHKTRATVCGASAIHLVLASLPEKAKFTMLTYENSGRISGDWSHCVSYVGAMIETDWALPMKEPEFTPPIEQVKQNALSPQAAAILLDIAKEAVKAAVTGSPARDLGQNLPAAIAQELQAPRGAFVTLTKNGALRGCIGEILPQRSLLRVVIERARSAALEDPRFRPVHPAELPELTFEVSVLSPPSPVASWKDIQIGTHGVILRKSGRGAVFLPQVATEQGWDVQTMLTQLSLKAGLLPDDWKQGASFEVFTAQIIHQKK